MSAPPVVVQGTPVTNPGAGNGGFTENFGQEPSNSNGEGGWASVATPHGGEKAETRCNDPIFALLFYACVAAIVGVAVVYGPAAMTTSNNSSTNYEPFVIYVTICCVISAIVCAFSLSVMMCIPETLIKIALIFSVVMAGVWAALAFVSGQWVIGIIGVIFFLISCCYAYAVWSRIPFATANLVTAITAIRKNIGVTFYAYVFALVAALWSICWSVAFAGIYDKTYVCTQSQCDANYGYLFLMFLAFFFGAQVFQYSVHVIVAGTVGTWWYEPNECGCCASSVHNSFLRTVTTSFGSICFGGFVVAVIRALQMLAQSAQDNGDANFCACIAECLLRCLADLVEYLNKWAFIYVGIYGFSYLKSARSVFTLFANRGWEAVIADDLVANTLLLMSLVSGAIVGAIGILVQVSTGVINQEDIGVDNNLLIFVFIVGLIVGFALCSILMSTIGSGVNTVIVLFAEAPAEFQQNYPELSNRMREVWSRVYPGSV